MSSLPPGMDLCAIPAAEPPPGHIPNLVNPPSLAGATVAVTTVTLTWAALFTAARLYTNFRKLTLADGFVVIALVLSVIYNGLTLAMLKYTRHLWDIPACWFTAEYMKMLYAQGLLLGPVIFFAKSSIFLLCRQIFTIQKTMKYAIWFGLLFTFLLYVPGIPLESYYAAPHIGETWDDLLLSKRPDKLIYWGIVQGTLAVVLDIYIFILPLPLLSKLQLPRRKRWQILTIFSTALMGVVASVIALAFRVRLLLTTDTTFTQSALFICVNVENNVAIIVSSMPFFATFFKSQVLESALFKSLRSRLSSSYGSSSVGTVEHTDKVPPARAPSRAHLLEESMRRYHELRDFPYKTNTEIHGGATEKPSKQARGISCEINIEQEIQKYSFV